jgi:hypothetical protein
MIKLPPTLKHLLSLRNPSLAPIPVLNSVLRSTLSDAKKRNVEDAWLVLTVYYIRSMHIFLQLTLV